MRYFLLCIGTVLMSLQGYSQLGVGGTENLFVQSGTIFSVDSLVFIPSSDLTVSNNNLTHIYTPAAGTLPGTNSIARVYQLSAPFPVYNGQVGIIYSDAELAGNTESLLQIAYKTASGWTTTAASSVDMVNNYVSYPATGIIFNQITATTAGVTLPITYKGFAASLKDQYVLLSWLMDQTDDLSGFDIEYSNDGRTWSVASSIAAPAGKKDFTYQHNDLNFSTRYYRIAMIDNDGHKIYTRIATVKNGNAGAELQVMRTGSSIMLYFSGKVPSTIRVFDMKGQLMMTRNTAMQQCEIPKLTPGIYVVQYIADGEKVSRRIQF